MSEVQEKTIVDTEFLKWFGDNYLGGEIKPMTHGIVKPTVASMTEQVRRFGEAVKTDVDVIAWKQACLATAEMFSPLVGSCSYTPIERVMVNPDSANGVPLDRYYKKKGEAISGCYAFLEWFVEEGWKTHRVNVVKLTGKVERLHLTEIRENKCRAFQPDPVQIILFEAMLCQDMTERLLALRDSASAYGFNKWFGGWDALFRRLDRGKYKFAGDVKRWDKYYQQMHHDANTELKKTFINADHRYRFETDMRFDFINEHARALPLLLWTGDVIQLSQGQGSGRFCTTFDNIMTHIRVMYYHYFRVRRAHSLDYLPVRTFEIREFYDPVVFGDDSCGCTDIPELASFEERSKSYSDVGFVLKLEDDFKSESIIGIPFLGAKCGEMYGKFTFVMDPKRVFGSLTALARDMTYQEKFERTFQIFMNCVFTEEPFPNTEVPTWQLLRERVVYMRKFLAGSDLGAYGNILSVEAYRNYALGLENGTLSTSGGLFFDPSVEMTTTTPLAEVVTRSARVTKDCDVQCQVRGEKQC